MVCAPLIDEVGYLSYSNRHADLLFELVSRRYQHKSTLVVAAGTKVH
jgi:DNA replication protein DnaC